jgi:DEAD/DEAH box helicase domain-containing protein
LTPADLSLFGEQATTAVLEDLVARRVLRRRPSGWYWTSAQRPRSPDIRGTGGEPLSIVDGGTGSLLGTVVADAAHSTLHAGAVYLHQGRSFLVDSLDLERNIALVHLADPDWTTSARDITDIAILDTLAARTAGPVHAFLGTVDMTNQVVSYQRRAIRSGEILDETPLDLPARQLRTRAVWYTVDQAELDAAGLVAADVPGAAHAAEHAAIGLLPLFATCDRWDIGGVSTALHEDTGRATVFVYDGHPGGAGFAERGFVRGPQWLRATADAIAACECASGCPSCVQSPKCGNGNSPLDKAGAHRLLTEVLAVLDAPSAASRRPEIAGPSRRDVPDPLDRGGHLDGGGQLGPGGQLDPGHPGDRPGGRRDVPGRPVPPPDAGPAPDRPERSDGRSRAS